MGHSLTLLVLCIFSFTLARGILEKETSCMLSKNDASKCYYFIPKHLPDGVTRVELILSLNVTNIRSSHFEGKGWSNITSLVIISSSFTEELRFSAGCFGTLIRLKELHIHVIRSLLHTDAFSGLRSLEVLDLTNSTDMTRYDLLKVLAASSLPKLRTLIIAGIGIEYGYTMDEDFWAQIEKLKVSYLDISYVRTNTFNATALIIHSKYLRTLIARGVSIGLFLEPEVSFDVLTKVEVLDFSGISNIGKAACVVSRFSDYKNMVLSLDKVKALSTVRDLYIDSLCNGQGVVHNFTNLRNISFESTVPVNLESLSVNKNGLAYFDVTFSGYYTKMIQLSASDNLMEYLNPNVLLSLYSLNNLDLSMNKLESMNRQNAMQFQALLKPLSDLRHFNLLRNGLLSIPEFFFTNNSKKETIDLSGNKLQQVHFELKRLRNLNLLNLTNNAISVLDAKSMNALDELMRSGKLKVDMSKNYLSCRECIDLDSVRWLVRNRHNIAKWEELKCLSGNGQHEIINENTVENLNQICQKRRNIIIWSTAGSLSLCFAVLVIFLTRQYFKHKKTAARLENVLRMFVDKELGHEFVVIISFSSDDQETVLRYLLLPFEQKLQQIVGVERDLICSGDKHFRVGYPILQETLRCLNMSCVVVFVVSDSFCRSEFCRNEFLQAYEIGKPIILIVKEECNEDLMPPLLKEVFLKKTRIIWLLKEDGFTLKTTWENICHSILDLCANNV